MTLQELVSKYNIPDVLTYAAIEERNFECNADNIGYKRRTTFYSDLSIAEWYGVDGIKDTYNRVCKEWMSNVEYFTEFVLSLNWKCWTWAQNDNQEFAQLYQKLYEEAYNKGLDTYKGEDASYFWSTLD